MRLLGLVLTLVLVCGCRQSLSELQAQRDELERSRTVLIKDVAVLSVWLDPTTTSEDMALLESAMDRARGEDYADVALKEKKEKIAELDEKLKNIGEKIEKAID